MKAWLLLLVLHTMGQSQGETIEARNKRAELIADSVLSAWVLESRNKPVPVPVPMFFALFITTGAAESGSYTRSVHIGDRVSSIGALGLWQIGPGNRLAASLRAEGPLVGLGPAETLRNARAGIRTLIWGVRHCWSRRYHTYWAEAAGTIYGVGSRCHPFWGGAKKRAKKAKRLLEKFPFPKNTVVMQWSYLKPGEITVELRKKADVFLVMDKPVGFVEEFTMSGIKYMALVEQHYHEPGGDLRPWGWHRGVSLLKEEQ